MSKTQQPSSTEQYRKDGCLDIPWLILTALPVRGWMGLELSDHLSMGDTVWKCVGYGAAFRRSAARLTEVPDCKVSSSYSSGRICFKKTKRQDYFSCQAWWWMHFQHGVGGGNRGKRTKSSRPVFVTWNLIWKNKQKVFLSSPKGLSQNSTSR